MPNIIYLDKVDSTNSYVKARCKELSDGDVVTARLQTAGRGRLGHRWAANEGMLPISILLKDPPECESITARVGLAVCEALEELCGLSAAIKWTNDIIVSSRKVCGILCESVIFGECAVVIAGIGVNVSQTADFFAELPNAASVLMLTGKAPERGELIKKIAERVTLRAAMSFAECCDEYKPRVINLGRQVRIISPTSERIAEAVDISERGFLVCRDDGGIFEVNSGEVSVRGVDGYF